MIVLEIYIPEKIEISKGKIAPGIYFAEFIKESYEKKMQEGHEAFKHINKIIINKTKE